MSAPPFSLLRSVSSSSSTASLSKNTASVIVTTRPCPFSARPLYGFTDITVFTSCEDGKEIFHPAVALKGSVRDKEQFFDAALSQSLGYPQVQLLEQQPSLNRSCASFVDFRGSLPFEQWYSSLSPLAVFNCLPVCRPSAFTTLQLLSPDHCCC